MNVSEDDAGHAPPSAPSARARSSADYHTDYNSGDSHSSLELFRESPAKYAAIRIARTMPAFSPSPPMLIGQALHAVLFEYDKECHFGMRGPRKKTPPSSPWYDAVDLAVWKSELSEKQMGLVFDMWLALQGEPDAWNLLVQQQGLNEQVFYVSDPLTSLRMKCKPDRVLEIGLVVDLKTVDGPVDPSTWSRTLAKWGYHRQAAFYLDVLSLAGQWADRFVFVAVSKDPPHEIGIYVLNDESIEQGRRENRDLLDGLAECRRTGLWKHEWQGKVLTAGVPRWALSQ